MDWSGILEGRQEVVWTEAGKRREPQAVTPCTPFSGNKHHEKELTKAQVTKALGLLYIPSTLY